MSIVYRYPGKLSSYKTRKVEKRYYSTENMNDAIVHTRSGYYKLFNERFVITRDNNPSIYKVLDTISKDCNILYNPLTSIQRKYFFDSNRTSHIPYQDLLNYLENQLSDESYEDKELLHLYTNIPVCVRKGIVLDVCRKWYNFTHKFGTTNIPRFRIGYNRKISFTINPNTIRITKNSDIQDGYSYGLILPKELGINLTIPTNIQSKSSIVSIRVTPNRGKFFVDIKYQVKYNYGREGNNMGYFTRLAGIDLGVDNLVALATNVGTKPVLIKGSRILALNKYYNNLLKNCKKGSKKYNALNNRRINKIRNYLTHCAKLITQYLELACIGILYIGYSDSVKKGFNNDPNFLSLDYRYLINDIKRRCYKANIKVCTVDEYYTSTSCALDRKYVNKASSNPKDRISNRLFKSETFGVINSDINSAFNIMQRADGNSPRTLSRILQKVLTGKSELKRIMVSPLVISNILDFEITNENSHPKELYIDLRSGRENWQDQNAKPFADYYTKRLEMIRVKSLIPG